MEETRTETIWLDEDGIMHYVTKPTDDHLLEDAIENIEAAKRIANGKAYPSLIDIRNTRKVSQEARNVYISKENTPVSKCAILVGSAVGTFVGNFFVGLNRTTFPTKLFYSEKEAMKWLKS